MKRLVLVASVAALTALAGAAPATSVLAGNTWSSAPTTSTNGNTWS